MLKKSLTIENFHNFKSLYIDSLSRINIFVGKCGVGKTDILDALYLSCPETTAYIDPFSMPEWKKAMDHITGLRVDRDYVRDGKLIVSGVDRSGYWKSGCSRRRTLYLYALADIRYCLDKDLLLIDEIETGIHHSELFDMWSELISSMRKREVQIFATTHSAECVFAAYEAFKKNGPYELMVYRLEKGEDGSRKVISIDEEALGTAIEQHWEFR